METQNFDDIPIIKHLSDQIAREMTSIRNPLHIWWARLPSVTARTAVFANLVPHSDEITQLLERLGVYPIDKEAVESARQSITAEFRFDLEDESDQQRPRLLDPFSGSGSISLAASHLGVEAHAVDINPVAFILQLCRITFPQRFGKPDQRFRGIDRNDNWAGLPAEVRYWSEWLDAQVQAEVNQVYPPLKNEMGDQLTPQAYFWAYVTNCENLSCHVQFPLINFPYLAKNAKRSISLWPMVNDSNKTVSLVAEASKQEPIPTLQRGQAVCPICGTKKALKADDIQDPQLIAILVRSDADFEYIGNGSQNEIQFDKTFLVQRIEALLQETGIQPLNELLPNSFAIQRYGFHLYSDIFTKRQLLLLLTLAKYIPVAHGQMLSQRYETERAVAVTTYLGLLLSNLVNDHNVFCRWQATREQSLPIYAYPRPSMAWTYVELNPFASTKSLHAYADRLTRAIEDNAAIEVPAFVRCASATSLPYPDAFFDGIVTAAPYYDAIPYADLSDIYFIWLRRSIGHLYPHEFGSSLTPKTDEIVVVHESVGKADKQRAVEDYRTKLGRALVEVERVLKPGRFFTMIVPTSRADVLQDFLGLTQAAGLDLVDVKRIRTTHTSLTNSAESYQALLTFRKSKLVQQTSQALVDAATVLQLADEGKPVLSSGLAHLLMENLEQEDLESLIPSEYRGPLEVRLIEYVNGCENPGALLDELGRSKLRKIVSEWGLSITNSEPKDAILKSFGFNVPEPDQGGLEAMIRGLPRKVSGVNMASSSEAIRGIYLTAITEFESLLKRAVWAWGEIVFGAKRDVQLRTVIDKDLDRLSMGDYQRLFLELPDYIASSRFSEQVKQILRRPHLYSTKKLAAKLDKIVALRNRIEHNKEEYLTTSPLDLIRKDVQTGLGIMQEVLLDLKERNAVPLIARPVRKTLDVFGRCSYDLKFEDGAVVEVYMTKDLALGRDYYYFWIETNPRPVDPPMLLVSSVLNDLP